ncbi:MAG: HNH endonuclease [Oscillatoriaceae cyanobacterium Prado104]|nr:HNH endonuclease [Oscillatoriaceae cyanobacterium Prado104]
MVAMKPLTLREVTFELIDSEIFKIPDTRTRLDTLQNYFFPRLEILLRDTLDIVQKVYGVNPYESMTFSYRPNHRKDATVNKDIVGDVHIGIHGKSRTAKDGYLTRKRKNGQPYILHSTLLNYTINPDGSMYVILFLCYEDCVAVNSDFFASIHNLFKSNFSLLNQIFTLNQIYYSSAEEFVDFSQAFSADNLSKFETYTFNFYSVNYYFPLHYSRGLWELRKAFIALYPLLDSLMRIEKGEAPQLSKMLKKYKNWYLAGGANYENEIESADFENTEPSLPELDSYSFVRAGLWWEILARDNWTCCSCKRSAQKHGVVLHVDHKIPRSKGGTNDKSNLQTLCMKCNIGKSNKDSTDLQNRI